MTPYIISVCSKAILTILYQDIIDTAGPLQLCAGEDSGREAAVHAICHMFEDPNTEALLLCWLMQLMHLILSIGRLLLGKPVSIFRLCPN